MNQALKLTLAAAALVGGTVLVTAAALHPQDKPDAKKPDAAKTGGPDPALWQKMMELGAPGKPHEELVKQAGTWDRHFKMRMSPDAPWQEFDGTAEVKPVLGGRYIQQDVTFSMMGMQGQGMQIIGFDNMSQEYVALWMDSMSTWWVTARGKKDATGAIELKGTMVDIAGTRPYRMVMHSKGDDVLETEMYDTIPPKGEVLMMTMTGKRKK